MKKNKKINSILLITMCLSTLFIPFMGANAKERTVTEIHNNDPLGSFYHNPHWVFHRDSTGALGYCINGDKEWLNSQNNILIESLETNNGNPSTYNSNLALQYAYIMSEFMDMKTASKRYYVTQCAIYQFQADKNILTRYKDSYIAQCSDITGLGETTKTREKVVDNARKVSNELVVTPDKDPKMTEDGKFYAIKFKITKKDISTIINAGDITLTGQPGDSIIVNSGGKTVASNKLQLNTNYTLKIPSDTVTSQMDPNTSKLSLKLNAKAPKATYYIAVQYCLKGSRCRSDKYQNFIFLEKRTGDLKGSGDSTIKFQCNFDKPDDFHVVDGSDDQDYTPNNKTNICCNWANNKYGKDKTAERYPICGGCPVKTSSKANECGVGDNSIILKDEGDFSCLFQGIDGNDHTSMTKVRQRYKVSAIGNKYCEVYCTEDVLAKFPGNYKGNVSPGGSLIWPSYNDDYKAELKTTRTCKLRFRRQEWLTAFNKADASGKSKLLKALNQCATSDLGGYYTDYINKLNPEEKDSPKLTLSYHNGASIIKDKVLKLDTKRSDTKDWTPAAEVSMAGISVSNVVSKLDSIATGIANKTMTVRTKLRYVLPDGLYQYVEKKSGNPLESYTPQARTDANGNVSNTTVTDSKESKLVVSDQAKTGQKYDLTLGYSNLSRNKEKFKNNDGNYVCKYTPTATPPHIMCDPNDPSQFEMPDSGPNGENCCEWFANRYGTDSEEYKKLVDEGLCPEGGPNDCDPKDPNCPKSCVYPDDLQSKDVAVKTKCCSMILVDPNYTLDERRKYYDEYCSGEPYCPQDCVDGVCKNSPMTQALRSCIASGKSYNECKVDKCPYGGRILIYRPISLYSTNGTSEAFPGVAWPSNNSRIWSNDNWYYYSNWAYRGKSQKRDYYVTKYITNNRGYKEYDLYNHDAMYTIELDASTIKSIRNHNQRASYDNFDMTCNKNGRRCTSNYLRGELAGKVTGCGMSGNWEQCPGTQGRGE